MDNNVLELKFEPGALNDLVVGYIYGVCRVHKGDILRLKYNNKLLRGVYRIKRITVKELRI